MTSLEKMKKLLLAMQSTSILKNYWPALRIGMLNYLLFMRISCSGRSKNKHQKSNLFPAIPKKRVRY